MQGQTSLDVSPRGERLVQPFTDLMKTTQAFPGLKAHKIEKARPPLGVPRVVSDRFDPMRIADVEQQLSREFGKDWRKDHVPELPLIARRLRADKERSGYELGDDGLVATLCKFNVRDEDCWPAALHFFRVYLNCVRQGLYDARQTLKPMAGLQETS